MSEYKLTTVHDSDAVIVTKGLHMDRESGKKDIITSPGEVCCYHMDRDRDERLNIAISQYNLNYVFDAPDSRDYLYSGTLYKDIIPEQLPESVDLRPLWGSIFDQGSLGSCVSQSVSYQLRYLLRKSNPNTNMSRLFIYYNGRLYANYALDKDTGLTLRNGFQSVATYGAVKEDSFPYNVAKFATRPSDALYLSAKANKNITFYSVAQDLNLIKKCLKDGFGISFGMTLYSSFMSAGTASTGKVPVPKTASEQRAGGHAMTIVGYNDATKSFYVANSWGKGWGDNGFAHIPYEVILNKALVGDLWTPRTYTIESPPAPIPTPIPKPAPTPTPNIPSWAVAVQYLKGDKVIYMGRIYECTISHKSSNIWTPSTMLNVWKKL